MALKITLLLACLFLASCQLLEGATPLGAATTVADAAAEHSAAQIEENIANSELSVARQRVQAAKLIFDAFKSCMSEFQVDLKIDKQRSCSACAERFDVDKAVCTGKP